MSNSPLDRNNTEAGPRPVADHDMDLIVNALPIPLAGDRRKLFQQVLMEWITSQARSRTERGSKENLAHRRQEARQMADAAEKFRNF